MNITLLQKVIENESRTSYGTTTSREEMMGWYIQWFRMLPANDGIVPLYERIIQFKHPELEYIANMAYEEAFSDHSLLTHIFDGYLQSSSSSYHEYLRLLHTYLYRHWELLEIRLTFNMPENVMNYEEEDEDLASFLDLPEDPSLNMHELEQRVLEGLEEGDIPNIQEEYILHELSVLTSASFETFFSEGTTMKVMPRNNAVFRQLVAEYLQHNNPYQMTYQQCRDLVVKGHSKLLYQIKTWIYDMFRQVVIKMYRESMFSFEEVKGLVEASIKKKGKSATKWTPTPPTTRTYTERLTMEELSAFHSVDCSWMLDPLVKQPLSDGRKQKWTLRDDEIFQSKIQPGFRALRIPDIHKVREIFAPDPKTELTKTELQALRLNLRILIRNAVVDTYNNFTEVSDQFREMVRYRLQKRKKKDNDQ